MYSPILWHMFYFIVYHLLTMLKCVANEAACLRMQNMCMEIIFFLLHLCSKQYENVKVQYTPKNKRPSKMNNNRLVLLEHACQQSLLPKKYYWYAQICFMLQFSLSHVIIYGSNHSQFKDHQFLEGTAYTLFMRRGRK